MALVREFKSANGATVRIYDDCYRDLTPEELAERKREIARQIWRIDRANQLRAIQARNNNNPQTPADDSDNHMMRRHRAHETL